jgi:hypothetical protein
MKMKKIKSAKEIKEKVSVKEAAIILSLTIIGLSFIPNPYNLYLFAILSSYFYLKTIAIVFLILAVKLDTVKQYLITDIETNRSIAKIMSSNLDNFFIVYSIMTLVSLVLYPNVPLFFTLGLYLYAVSYFLLRHTFNTIYQVK